MSKHSAEFLRGAIKALDELGDAHPVSLMAYRDLLAEAEAREAAEPDAAAISADRAWIDGAKFGWNCETKADLHEAISNRQQQIREERLNPSAPDAAAVIAQCKAALDKAQGYVGAFEFIHKCAWGDNSMCESAKNDLTATGDAVRSALAAIAAWEAGRV